MSLETAKRVLRVESEAIAGLIARLDARFEKAVELLHSCKGRVVVTGLGKSGLVGRKISATFASTGTPRPRNTAARFAGEARSGPRVPNQKRQPSGEPSKHDQPYAPSAG